MQGDLRGSQRLMSPVLTGREPGSSPRTQPAGQGQWLSDSSHKDSCLNLKQSLPGLWPQGSRRATPSPGTWQPASCWGDPKALSAEPGLSWGGIMGEAHLRSSESSVSPQTGRDHMAGSSKGKVPGRALPRDMPSSPRHVVGMVTGLSIRNKEDGLQSGEGLSEAGGGREGTAYGTWSDIRGLVGWAAETPAHHGSFSFPGPAAQPGGVPKPLSPLPTNSGSSRIDRHSHLERGGQPGWASCFSIWPAPWSCRCEPDSRWTRGGRDGGDSLMGPAAATDGWSLCQRARALRGASPTSS